MDKKNRFANAKGFAYWLLPLITGIFLGALLHNYIFADPYPSTIIPKDSVPSFNLIAEAWNAINSHYVDRKSVQPRTMTYGAISGMVDSLGDTGHSGFLTPEMVQAEHTIEVGHFAGIGAEIQMKNNRPTIVAPMDGSPAQKAGIRPGDIVAKVDAMNTNGLNLREVVNKILGPAGTSVTLTLEDPSTGKKRSVTIKRANITLQSVMWRMLPDLRIAHVRIAFFSKGTSEELGKALSAIEKQGAQGVVLDLRNDPGGLLDMAIGVASRFLESGTVLQEKDAKGKLKAVPIETGNRKCSLPLVVLINAGTASASEIVAGALQDAERAVIVGETTFGTGTVLNIVPLSDGSALQLAVLEWLTPNGRIIWHKGITPDVKVALPAHSSPMLPEAEQGMTLAQLRSSKDLQLIRAVEILKNKEEGTRKGVENKGNMSPKPAR